MKEFFTTKPIVTGTYSLKRKSFARMTGRVLEVGNSANITIFLIGLVLVLEAMNVYRKQG